MTKTTASSTKLLQSDLANSLVDMSAEYDWQKLG